MTLPELLVAITILSILFGLLILPVMKAFGFIRTSNVRVEAQSVGRGIFEMMIREVSDAIYLYDNKDDPTESSLIMVAPSGLASNAGQAAGTNGPSLPPLITPGPGSEYNVQPVVKQLMVALMRSKPNSQTASPLPYWSQWEMESADLRSAGLADIPSPAPTDNLYRLVYLEYFLPNSTGQADAAADPFLLPNILGSYYDANRPDAFREPGYFDDSLFTRMPRGATPPGALCNSPDAAERRRLVEYNGLLVGLTPRENVDMAQASYTPAIGNVPGTWAAKPGVRFESLSVANESLDPVVTGGATYPSAYRADYGHWQTVRRKEWSHPLFNGTLVPGLPIWARYYQVFDVRAAQRYDYPGGQRIRDYYVSAGRTDNAGGGVPPTEPRYYYIFRLTGGVPVEGVWPATDVATFNTTLYKQRIDAWHRRSNESPVTFWNDNDPYGGNNNTLNLLPASHNEPYWPEMAFLLEADRGTADFRVDAPVRPPTDTEPQPPGPLAPFQAPYGTDTADGWYQPGPNGNRADWMIPDVRLAKRDANSGKYNNGDGAALLLGPDENTTWIRIPSETMRVMVGYEDPLNAGQYLWKAYTRATEPTLLNPGEFWFNEETGQLSFDPDETGNWDANFKIRAWYQIQTNVQRRNQNYPPDSTDGQAMTASYFTKEVLRMTLALRAYDTDTGKVQPFQLSATVRPRNLR